MVETACAASASRRVLVIAPFIWEGGPGRGKPTVAYTLQGFRRAGYEVHVVTATNRRGVAAQQIDGVWLHHFGVPVPAISGGFDAWHSFLTLVRSEPNALARHLRFRLWWTQFVILAARKALSVARAHPPALTYGVNNPGIPPAWFVARRLDVPTFGRIMGSEIAQLARVDLDDDRPGSRPRPTAVRAIALGLARFDELLAFRLPGDGLFVTDDGQIGPRTVSGWLGVPPERLHLWRNGIDKARFAVAPDRAAARASLGIPHDASIVLWVSQLIDWKQPELLLDALPAVVAGHSAVRCVLVGDGPARQALEARAAALGVSDRVTFTGFVEQSDVPRYYRAADVFVACYRRANVSNTLLEAMLSGLAVVALDNGRTREVVRHEANGLLVDPARPDGLADALARVLADADLRSRIGRAGAAWAADHLETWDERVAREVRTIESVVHARAAHAE